MPRHRLTYEQRQSMDETLAAVNKDLAAIDVDRQADKAAHPERFVWILTRSTPVSGLVLPAAFRSLERAQSVVLTAEDEAGGLRAVTWEHPGRDPTALVARGSGGAWWYLDEAQIDENNPSAG